MNNGISLGQSPKARLGLDWDCIGNEGGPDQRFRHGYDTMHICSCQLSPDLQE